MAMEKQDEPELRVLMFPWLAHGHIFPFLELAKTLSATKTCFTIHICCTSVNLDSLRSSLSGDDDDASIKLVQLHLSAPPELPPLLHTTKNLPPNLFPTLIQAFLTSTSSFSDIMDTVQPHLLIYDYFQPWAAKMAASKGIPSVFFSVTGATPFCYDHHRHTMGTASTFPYKAIFQKDHERFTGDIRDPVYKIEGADYDDFAFGNFTLSSDFVLMKSFPEIEEKYIDYLTVLCKKQIVSTGPLIAKVKPYDEKESGEIFQWLSGKNQGSTVLVSFGSECFLSKEKIAEIAKGLQLCQVNFVWVIRFPVGEEPPSSVEASLPAGFLQTVNQRGLIIGRWAPQANILCHPSIGGFVSHCGWGSVTESLYFGVPLVAIPMLYEQPLSARVVVEAGVGVEVERDLNGGFVGEDVAKAIDKLMVDDYEGMRERVNVISQKMKENEKRHEEDVAEQLMRICIKNNKKQASVIDVVTSADNL